MNDQIRYLSAEIARLQARVRELENIESNLWAELQQAFENVNPKLETRIKELEEGIEKHKRCNDYSINTFGRARYTIDEELYKLLKNERG